MAFVVRNNLFARNDAGRAGYVTRVRESAPWFDIHEQDDDGFRPRGGKLVKAVCR
jgi:hypothetical protein